MTDQKKKVVDRKGNKNPMFHRTHTDETKERIRQKIKKMWEPWTNDSTL